MRVRCACCKGSIGYQILHIIAYKIVLSCVVFCTGEASLCKILTEILCCCCFNHVFYMSFFFWWHNGFCAVGIADAIEYVNMVLYLMSLWLWLHYTLDTRPRLSSWEASTIHVHVQWHSTRSSYGSSVLQRCNDASYQGTCLPSSFQITLL